MGRTAGSKRITISDIASIAGVAKSTVSEVINHNSKSRVSQKTFAKVQAVIEHFHYVPLPVAQALKTNRTCQLGFLVSSTATLGLANSFFATMIAGVERVCNEHGYKCTIGRYDFSSAVQDFVMQGHLRQHAVDALIIAGTISGACQKDLTTLGIPVTIIGTCTEPELFELGCDMVNTHLGVWEYLTSLGHRTILLPCYYQTELEQLQASLKLYNRSHARTLNGIIWKSSHELGDFENGLVMANHVFETKKLESATALYANDQICSGFLQGMIGLGYNCPQDFSIFSCCDTPICEWNAIPLSSVKQIAFEHGKIAAEQMIDLVEGVTSADDVKQVFLGEFRKVGLNLRKSCAAPSSH